MSDVLAGLTSLALTRLLQLASPALPVGAYSYSSGLEAALDGGLVSDADSALAWIGDAIELGQGRFDAAAVAAACRAGDDAEIEALDRRVLAARETAELRLEAEQVGYSLGAWLAQVPTSADPEGEGRPSPAAARTGPVAYGLAAGRLGLTPTVAATAWLWGFAENQVMVLIKAMPLGQIGGQRLLWALGPVISRTAARATELAPEAWSSALPGLAIVSMAHERQYSRLFRS